MLWVSLLSLMLAVWMPFEQPQNVVSQGAGERASESVSFVKRDHLANALPVEYSSTVQLVSIPNNPNARSNGGYFGSLQAPISFHFNYFPSLNRAESLYLFVEKKKAKLLYPSHYFW